MKFDIEKESLIIKPYANNAAIYIREQKGRFQQIRRMLSWTLMLIFIAIPWISYQGQQAVLFDIGSQHFRVFNTTFLPQDLMILAWLFMASAFALFFVTNWLGRVWCGFICPQTIWMLMFTWVEHRIEGSRNQRIKLDKSDWTRTKITKKVIKHVAWLAISFVTATTFISYFVPVTTLYGDLLSLNWSGLVFFWVIFFTACTYGNAGFLREKMCTVACPYARFQSVMFDKDTKLVTYDQNRGEMRGPRKRKSDPKQAGLGDCVDCGLCVDVCPAGIDIRNGLQYECINCGLCIDACNDTMKTFGYTSNLISYQSEHSASGVVTSSRNLKRVGYASLTGLTVIIMLVWLNLRTPIEVSVIRDRNTLYRVDYQGRIENPYTLTILNKTQRSLSYRVVVSGIDDIELVGPESIQVSAGEMVKVPVTVISNETNLEARTMNITFKVQSLEDELIVSERPSVFYSM